MAWYNEEYPETLNFIVAGNCRSGCGLLQSSLAAHPAVVCHGDVLHKDENTRKEEHEAYFGDSGKVPDWYLPGHLSVEQYLNNKIFDNALMGEQAIGVKVSYDLFVQQDLWDYVDQKCRQGDFCLVHVVRNPVACLASLKQIQGATQWADIPELARINPTVDLEPTELTNFVRNHMALELKVDRLCPDRVKIPYHELVLDFESVLQRLSKFLGIEYSSACTPNRKRLNGQDMKSRIGNWAQLKSNLPHDVLEQLDSPTLF